MRTLTFNIPDEIYRALQQLAAKSQRQFEDVAIEYLARHAAKSNRKLTDDERRESLERLERFAGAIDSGDPNSADNERIDLDLAREYGDGREPES